MLRITVNLLSLNLSKTEEAMEFDDAEVFGIECVTFDYECLGGNLAKTDWVKKVEDGSVDASELINQFSSYFFNKVKGKSMDMQILLLMSNSCAQIAPSSLNNQVEKEAFVSVLPEIIASICEEKRAEPIMAMMCFEGWTCAVRREVAAKVGASIQDKSAASAVKAKIVEEVLHKWGSISSVPNNHAQVCKFDGMIHLSFFNDAHGPVVVMNKRPCHEEDLKKIDPDLAEEFVVPVVSRNESISGVLTFDTAGFRMLGLDEASLK